MSWSACFACIWFSQLVLSWTKYSFAVPLMEMQDRFFGSSLKLYLVGQFWASTIATQYPVCLCLKTIGQCPLFLHDKMNLANIFLLSVFFCLWSWQLSMVQMRHAVQQEKKQSVPYNSGTPTKDSKNRSHVIRVKLGSYWNCLLFNITLSQHYTTVYYSLCAALLHAL